MAQSNQARVPLLSLGSKPGSQATEAHVPVSLCFATREATVMRSLCTTRKSSLWCPKLEKSPHSREVSTVKNKETKSYKKKQLRLSSQRWRTGPQKLAKTLCSSRHLKMLQELNLTTCQLCVFYFNLCIPLLLFTQRILSIHNDLPGRTLPLCLNVKPKCLCSGKHPDPVCLEEKRNIHIPSLRALAGIIAKPGVFLLYSSSPPDPNEMVILRQSAI